MPNIRITVDGRPALTTAQAALRRGVDQAGLRRVLSRMGIEPIAHLDDRTPLYSRAQIDKLPPPRALKQAAE